MHRLNRWLQLLVGPAFIAALVLLADLALGPAAGLRNPVGYFTLALFSAALLLVLCAGAWRGMARADRLYVAAHAAIWVGLPLLAGALLLAGD
jgi:hypothetical protein